MLGGRVLQGGNLGHAGVQAGGDIHAQFQRLHQLDRPGLGDLAAPVRPTQDHGLRTLGGGFLDGGVRQAEIGLAARQAELTDAPFRAPDLHTVGGLRCQLVRRIAEKQQIGILDVEGHWPISKR